MIFQVPSDCEKWIVGGQEGLVRLPCEGPSRAELEVGDGSVGLETQVGMRGGSPGGGPAAKFSLMGTQH